MDLPEAPIAHECIFSTLLHRYVRILGGKVIRPDNPCYIKLANRYSNDSASIVDLNYLPFDGIVACRDYVSIRSTH